MPDPKKTRNPFGSILVSKVKVRGRTVTAYDARKRYRDTEGRPKQKFQRCWTRGEAVIALGNINAEIQRELSGVIEASSTVPNSFFQLLNYFEAEYIKPAVFIGDKQIAGYRSDLKPLKGYLQRFREFFSHNPAVGSMTYEDARRYSEYLATRKTRYDEQPSIGTINKELGFLRRVFNVAIQLAWRESNPFNLGKPLIDRSSERIRERILEFDEEERILAACEGSDTYTYIRKKTGKPVTVTLKNNPRPHLKLVVIFALESAMRKREMFTTAAQQIDFENDIIVLNPRQTKALKKRFIPMSARLKVEMLKLFEANQFKANDLIFGGLKGTDRSFRTACRRAGVEGMTFHGLRHTALTWWDDAEISRAARNNIGGHSDDRMHQLYTNVSKNVLDSARSKMDKYREKIDAKVNAKVNKEIATS